LDHATAALADAVDLYLYGGAAGYFFILISFPLIVVYPILVYPIVVYAIVVYPIVRYLVPPPGSRLPSHALLYN
jgi:hypothetical protein